MAGLVIIGEAGTLPQIGRQQIERKAIRDAEAAAWRLRAAHDLWISDSDLSNSENIVLTVILRQFYTRRSLVVDRQRQITAAWKHLGVSQ